MRALALLVLCGGCSIPRASDLAPDYIEGTFTRGWGEHDLSNRFDWDQDLWFAGITVGWSLNSPDVERRHSELLGATQTFQVAVVDTLKGLGDRVEAIEDSLRRDPLSVRVLTPPRDHTLPLMVQMPADVVMPVKLVGTDEKYNFIVDLATDVKTLIGLAIAALTATVALKRKQLREWVKAKRGSDSEPKEPEA